MSRIAFFDLARHTGVAFDGATPGVPMLSAIQMPKPVDQEYGPLYSRLRKRATEIIINSRIEIIGFESAISPMAMPKGKDGELISNPGSRRLLMGYVATIECLAEDMGLKCVEKPTNSIRKYFVGDGRADKLTVMKMCMSFGWDIEADDNKADAAAGWSYLHALQDPRWSPIVARRGRIG